MSGRPLHGTCDRTVTVFSHHGHIVLLYCTRIMWLPAYAILWKIRPAFHGTGAPFDNCRINNYNIILVYDTPPGGTEGFPYEFYENARLCQ